MNFFDLLNATAGEIVILDATVDTCCPFCGKRHSIEVNEADYFDWQDGKCAQDAFPYLSADDREMLISGICPTCWDEMFGSDEEPDPDEVDIHGNTFGGEEPVSTLDNDAFAQMAINVMKAILNGEVE